jgi:hypothetical protein
MHGIARADVEQTVTSVHGSRRRNARGADWVVRRGGIVVAYNHPDAGDPLVALVVTVWRAA